jgi:delta 1-pyrroline-5-carboxylate dehydrogenase
LERANATEYGLAAGVFTSNLNWATTLSRGLKAGTIWVNTWNTFDAGVPFGGYKMSGIGREHGEAALSHYTQVIRPFLSRTTSDPPPIAHKQLLCRTIRVARQRDAERERERERERIWLQTSA